MHRSIFALPLVALVASTPALAGEEPLYQPAPEWVQEAALEDVTSADGPAAMLFDWQYRLEDGVVHAFTDTASRLDNPQAVMQAGTISLEWLPDNGDIIIHRVEILRDGEVIDLLDQGVTFDVLRRERALEQRFLDGELTATMAVPGLRQDDILRVSYTVTNDEPALGEEMQAFQYLPSEPWQVGFSRVVASWPVDAEIYYDAEDRVDLPEPETRGGYKYLELALPLAEREPRPMDAPSRYNRPDVLRIGTFSDWLEVSSTLAPHFEAAAQLEAGSPVAEQADAIMARTSDPLERAALAVQLVQDEVSYLFEGLDGGGYLPQPAEKTWDVRYGDCKAKSVLLLSLLRHMDIESEVVLVNTQGGDAAPELLPLPAFDHMIVHAVIESTDYWLDGTSSATRLATIGNVLPFHYALPLRPEGTGLMAMEQRDPAVPQMRADMTMDHSAGIDFPTLLTLKMDFIGPAASQMQAMVDADNPELLRQMAQGFAGQQGMGMQVSDLKIAYDKDDATASIEIFGIGQPEFEWEEGRLRTNVDTGADVANFNPDRARPAWRDIPVATPGPMRQAFNLRMILPQDGNGFSLEGQPDLEAGYGNVRITRAAALENAELHTNAEIFSLLGEIAPSELPEVRRSARQLGNSDFNLVPPENVTWRWELSDAERAERAAPILAAYDDAIAFADEDNYTPLIARANFLTTIYDFDRALEDIDTLIEEQPSVWAFQRRSWLHRTQGDDAAMLADMRSAYELTYDNATAREVAQMLAYDGQFAEARELMDSLSVAEDDLMWHYTMMATIAAAEGELDEARGYISDAVAQAPQSAEALNSDCWFRGLWNSGLEDALDVCTRSIERASNAAAALDSRALIRFRQGDFEGAIADLDGALAIAPGLAESHYLRALAKMHAGVDGAEEDMTIALRMAPHLEDYYTRHGIVAP